MNSELTSEFVVHFRNLPERVKATARKNYRLVEAEPTPPRLGV